MRERNIIAGGYYYAPLALRARWNQLAQKATVQYWKNNRPDDYNQIREFAHSTTAPLLAVDINNRSTTNGQYGNPANFVLDYQIDNEFIEASDDHHVFDLYHQIGANFIENIREAVTSTVPNRLTLSEYLSYVAYQENGEKPVADAYDVSVGTIRSKVGRVRDKLEQAEEFQQAIDDLEHYQDLEKSGFHTNTRAVLEISEEEFPVDTASNEDGTYYEYTSYARDGGTY